MIAHYHVSLKEQHGICVLPLHPDDLVSHGLYILEALLVDQAVDQDEALAVLDVEIPHGRELLRPRRVQDLQHRRRRIHLDLLAVEVFDGRVVLLDEGPGHELDRESGFPDSSASQHHHLILAHCARMRTDVTRLTVSNPIRCDGKLALNIAEVEQTRSHGWLYCNTHH